MNTSTSSPRLLVPTTTARIPIRPPTPSRSEEQNFLCTFCWLVHPYINADTKLNSRDHSYTPTQPKCLGRSSRLACYSCWSRILDLSICWVCGEIIVRGEDVVSLGWCFWHWGCFGCLVCGMRMDVDEAAKILRSEWMEDDDGRLEKGRDQGRGGNADFAANKLQDELSVIQELRKASGKRHSKTIELESIPLCAEHMAETVTEAENFDSNLAPGHDLTIKHNNSTQLLEGRRNVKSRDGGLSEARWGVLVGLGMDDRRKLMDTTTAPLPPPIYVSIFDPLGDPAFRPSRTKPVPRWMASPELEQSQQEDPSESERAHERKRRRGEVANVEAAGLEAKAAALDVTGIKSNIPESLTATTLPPPQFSPPPVITEIRKKSTVQHGNDTLLADRRLGRSQTTVMQSSSSSKSSVSRYRALYEQKSINTSDHSQQNASLTVPINRPLVRASRSFTASASASSSEDIPITWYEARESLLSPPPPVSAPGETTMRGTALAEPRDSDVLSSHSKAEVRVTEQDATIPRDRYRERGSVVERFKRQEHRRGQMQMSMAMLREHREEDEKGADARKHTETEKASDLDGKGSLRLELKRLFNER